MPKLLKELYWLNNDQEFFKPDGNKALEKATAAFCECEEILTKELAGENLQTFVQLINAADDMGANIELDGFVAGLRAGAHLALEFFGCTSND